MSHFFTEHIKQQIGLNQGVLEGRKFRLVFFRYAPSLSTIQPAWRTAKTVPELLATSPGWAEVSDIEGYPFDETAISIGTRTSGGSRYVMYSRYPFTEMKETVEVSAIGVVLTGSLGGVTEPLVFVTTTPLADITNLKQSDALTSNPDADLPGEVNRWLFSWSAVAVVGTVTNESDLLTLTPAVGDVYLVAVTGHWWIYNGPVNDGLSRWSDRGVASVDAVEGALVISLGSPEFEVSGSHHAWMYPQRVNYIANPSFEAPETNYWSSNGDLTRVAGAAPGSGYFSGRTIATEESTTPAYVRLNGTPGCYIDGPDIAALAGARSLEIEMDCSLDDWTAEVTLVGQTVAPQHSWRLSVSGGNLLLEPSLDGTQVIRYASDDHGFTTRSRHVVGGRWVSSHGYGFEPYGDGEYGGEGGTPSDVQFKIDGDDFGESVSSEGLLSGLFDSSRDVQIGRDSDNTHRMVGNVYGLRIWADGVLVASPDFTKMTAAQLSITDDQGNVWTIKGAAAVSGISSTVIMESNTFSTQMGEIFNEQWTIQLMAKGSGRLKVGLVYWDADYRATASAWGEEEEEWVLSPDSWMHIAVHRHAPEAHLAMVRLELKGVFLTIDKVLAEPGYLKDWWYFDGDERYGARDDFSWYGGMQRQGGTYSLWYNHRRAVTGRLFARTVDPNDPTQNVTDEDMEEQGLIYRWVPAGITVVPHMDVLFPFDLQSPIPPKVSDEVLPYWDADHPDGVQNPWGDSGEIPEVIPYAHWDLEPGWDEGVWSP